MSGGEQLVPSAAECQNDWQVRESVVPLGVDRGSGRYRDNAFKRGVEAMEAHRADEGAAVRRDVGKNIPGSMLAMSKATERSQSLRHDGAWRAPGKGRESDGGPGVTKVSHWGVPALALNA